MGTKEQTIAEDRFPVRKHPRIPGYDYATPNYYFITICTHQKQSIFWTGRRLNRFGQAAWDSLLKIEELFPHNRMDSFVVMPNHIHMILVVEPGGMDATTVVGSFKSHITRVIHQEHPEMRVWQTSFHDHVIRSWKQYQKIREYIQNNPMRWNQDCFYME